MACYIRCETQNLVSFNNFLSKIIKVIKNNVLKPVYSKIQVAYWVVQPVVSCSKINYFGMILNVSIFLVFSSNLVPKDNNK